MNQYINKHHFSRYKRFIQSIDNSNYRGYCENHHIIPKSILKGSKLIKLTARQHYIAHKMLTKIFKKNTSYWFSMAKAFNFMFRSSKFTPDRYFSSCDYAYNKQLQSEAMKLNNPMHDKEVVKRATIASKNSWTPERREANRLRSLGRPLSESGKKKLSLFWRGSKRPETEEQIAKNIKASSCGKFITPWGTFDSPGQASRDSANNQNLSRFLINKFCKLNDGGFRFISNSKVERRGHWKK